MLARCSIIALAFFMLAFAGCDDAEELLADSERIVGSWELVGIADSRGDRSVVLAGFDEVSVRFESNLVYDLLVDFAQIGGLDAEQRYGGNYTVVPATRFVTLTAEIEGTPTPIPFAYEFDGDDRIGLSADSDLLEPLLTIAGQELPLEGEVTLTFARTN
jgi:hypothetical protein